jgi:protein-disulfide isomerase
VVLPELEKKYIDTGRARLILREFPLDGLAVAAFMLARCAGPDRYYPMVGALFETQETWAVPGADGKEKLLLIAKQAGFSKETFDQCLADKELFQKIVDTRARGNEEFGVDSTPSFFVNGKRLTGEHTLQDFENALGGGTPAADGAASPAGDTPSEPEGASGQ